MAGRGRQPPPHALGGARGPFVGHGPLHPGPGHYGPGLRPHMGPPFEPLPPPHILVEEKLATQHGEIQRLLSENQRLTATHVALRQELAATQQEIHRLQQIFGGLQTEKEQQLRALVDKSAQMEADLRATENIKVELQKAQTDAKELLTIRQDLSAQIQQLSQELHIAGKDAQQVTAIKAEMDSFRQEIQRARTAFELEKKANLELMDQRAVMEKNLVSMAREVEKLRGELSNAEKKARAGSYAGGYTSSDSGYPSMASYGESYGMPQIPVAAENGSSYGSGPQLSRGGYETQRSAPHGWR